MMLCQEEQISVAMKKNTIVDYQVLFLRRAHCPIRPQLDSNPHPADHNARALTVAPTLIIVITVVTASHQQLDDA